MLGKGDMWRPIAPISTMSEIKTYVKLDNWLQVSTEVQGPDLVSGLFSWIPQEIGYIFQGLLKFRLSLFPLLLIGSVGQKMVDQWTRILVMQDS